MLKYSLVLLLILYSFQPTYKHQDQSSRPFHTYRLAFYNVENLFDPTNDSLTQDDEFTLESIRHWNAHRYNQKLIQLSKTLIALGGERAPELIGFCEIENKQNLLDLIYRTPLSNQGYSIVHRDSPDKRGIDVGFIYQKDRIKLLACDWISVQFPWDTVYTTRDIVHAKLLFGKEDTLHYFLNHWPSKWKGVAASEPYRIQVANKLRSCVDSIMVKDQGANVLIVGDFNDELEDRSIQQGLLNSGNTSLNSIPVNHQKNVDGSHKFQGGWSTIDQYFVSYSMMNSTNGLFVSEPSYEIFSPAFLLEPDEKYGGLKPKRTYLGMRYNGGFSDHLPIYIDISVGSFTDLH